MSDSKNRSFMSPEAGVVLLVLSCRLGLVLLLLVGGSHSRLLGISWKALIYIRRQSVLLVFALHRFVRALATRTTVSHPKEDNRLPDKHANRAGGHADRDTDNDWQKDKRKEVPGEVHRLAEEPSMMVTVSSVMRLAEMPGDDVIVCGQVDDAAVFASVIVLGESWWGMVRVRVACKTVEAAHAEALHLFGGVLGRMGCGGGFGAGGGDGGG